MNHDQRDEIRLTDGRRTLLVRGPNVVLIVAIVAAVVAIYLVLSS